MKSLLMPSVIGVAASMELNFQGRQYAWEEPQCYLPLDVLFLQDTTQSFTEDLALLVPQIPSMVAAIEKAHPNSWFGVAEFKDKPFASCGYPEDYCYSLAGPLSANENNFFNAYSTLYSSGGYDYPESQYQGIITSFQYNKVGWRPMGSNPGEAGARLVIMSTDAQPHYSGEAHPCNALEWALPNDGQTTQDDITFDCNNKTYPTPDQVRAAVDSVPMQYLAILTPEDDSNVVGAWQWVNEDLLHQPAAFYQFIQNDSSNFIIGVLNAIAAVTQTACATTTTFAPITSSELVTTVEPVTTVELVTTTASSTTASTTTASTTTGSTTTAATTTAPTTTVLTPTAPITTVQTTAASTPTLAATTLPTATTTTEPTTAAATTVHDITTTVHTTVVPTTTAQSETTNGLSTTGSIIDTTTGSVETTTAKADPCPCSSCGCKDGVVLKVGGHPKKIQLDLSYKN